MKDEQEIRAQLERLFASTDLAVLSTHHEDQSYASLVAFMASDDLRHLFFATSRSTRKYANLKAHPKVAMLIDNRSNSVADFRKAMAATVTGTAQELDESDKGIFAQAYLKRHPHLKEFITAPSCALIKMNVDTYILVTRFQYVMELHIK